MRVAVLVASAIFCSSLSACDTKKKLDNVLDNADDTITNANKRIDELADLAKSLQSDLSEAVKETGNAASKTLSSIGDAAGGIPASGGEVKGAEEAVDLDDDGKPDRVTAVEYEDKMLWLADASTLSSQFSECLPQLYFVTDKPPENLLSWGIISEQCGGAMACPPEELEQDEPDFDTCTCVDANDQAIDCQDFLASLAGSGEPQEEQVQCDSGGQAIPETSVCDGKVDCSDGSDEAAKYCGEGEEQVQCDTGSEVIPESAVCDGIEDCSDGSDEAAEYCGG